MHCLRPFSIKKKPFQCILGMERKHEHQTPACERRVRVSMLLPCPVKRHRAAAPCSVGAAAPPNDDIRAESRSQDLGREATAGSGGAKTAPGLKLCSVWSSLDENLTQSGIKTVFYRISSNFTSYLANPASPVSGLFYSTLRVHATGSTGMR